MPGSGTGAGFTVPVPEPERSSTWASSVGFEVDVAGWGATLRGNLIPRSDARESRDCWLKFDIFPWLTETRCSRSLTSLDFMIGLM